MRNIEHGKFDTPAGIEGHSEKRPEAGSFGCTRKVDFEGAPKKIGGASWVDPEKADEWSAELPQDRPVVVYCVKGGSVSQSIADRLQQSHSDVKFLQGGIKAWMDLGEPVAE